MQPNLHFNVEKIKNEYHRIDIKWLKMHFQAMLSLILITMAVEIGMFFVLSRMHAIYVSTEVYILKYILVPFACNLILLLLTYGVLRSRRCSDQQKIYMVSLSVTVCSLVIYTIHSVFPALFLIFSIPLILTIIYGDQMLTSMVALVCLAGKVVSDLYIFWDPDRPSVFADKYSITNFVISLMMMAILYGLCSFMIKVEREKNDVSIELEKERQRLQEDALTDELTGIGNRLALRDAFEEMEQSRGVAYSLAMMDLDDFKFLNDHYGHTRGDSYLRELGRVFQSMENPDIRAFRFGGDEFCVLFRGMPYGRMNEICREIQRRFTDSPVNRKFLMVSVSIGTAVYITGETPSRLLERADAALYRAKLEKGSICAAE